MVPTLFEVGMAGSWGGITGGMGGGDGGMAIRSMKLMQYRLLNCLKWDRGVVGLHGFKFWLCWSR